LLVGIADVVPKLLARRLLQPARRLTDPVHMVIQEDKPERLLAALAVHELDVVISDSPPGPGVSVRAFSHLLGECGVGLFATRALATKYRKGFPRSLDGAPLLVPTEGSTLRRMLERYFESIGVRPRVVAEIEDSALLAAFGQDGAGVFAASMPIAKEIQRQHGVELLGEASGVRETFYALTVERRIKHPAVVAISEGARSGLAL
jgi:LysR family transcriptional activator of nhaA